MKNVNIANFVYYEKKLESSKKLSLSRRLESQSGQVRKVINIGFFEQWSRRSTQQWLSFYANDWNGGRESSQVGEHPE